MKPYLILFVLTAVLGAGCAEEKSPLGKAQDYFPELSKLRQGVVNKYYVHHIPDNKNKEIMTDIRYRSYQLSNDNLLHERYYNAGMQLTGYRTLSMQGDSMQVIGQTLIHRGDTLVAEIERGLARIWSDSFSKDIKRIYRFENGFMEIIEVKSIDHKKGITEKRTGITFRSEFFYEGYSDERSDEHSYTIESTYVQGLGLYSVERNGGRVQYELVEQMPRDEFEDLADHGRQTTEYIDSGLTLDQGEQFSLCQHEEKIVSYYFDDGYNYVGGAAAISSVVNEWLDPSLLAGESGYLTYRFIVNCKGNAGRFVTEESSLDYEKKTFNEATVSHMFGIVKRLNDWRPVHHSGEYRDAYFYLTFKIENGEIIEILP